MLEVASSMPFKRHLCSPFHPFVSFSLFFELGLLFIFYFLESLVDTRQLTR